jgi:hypothetical protein
VTERALMKAIGAGSRSSHDGASTPGPRSTRGVALRSEWKLKEADAEAPASYQEPGEREEEPTKRLLDTMPSGNITATMSREPPHRPNAVVVMFPMRMVRHTAPTTCSRA